MPFSAETNTKFAKKGLFCPKMTPAGQFGFHNTPQNFFVAPLHTLGGNKTISRCPWQSADSADVKKP